MREEGSKKGKEAGMYISAIYLLQRSEKLQRGVRDGVLEFAMWSKDNQLHLYAEWAWYMCRRRKTTTRRISVFRGKPHLFRTRK